ncbi:MAG TPA: hypothetical protein VIK78_19635 [Ruminiclostridium sp.]
MTYLEKARELNPKLTQEDLTDWCPEHFKLEVVNCCDIKLIPNSCAGCWNREMPVEVKK